MQQSYKILIGPNNHNLNALEIHLTLMEENKLT